MFDAFPYDAWGGRLADFWTFGGAARPARAS